MKVTVGRKRRWLAFLCIASMIVASVIFPDRSKASDQEDLKYMNFNSLTYGLETGMEDAYYVKAYDKEENGPEYMLGIPATGILPPGINKVKIVRIADSVFAGQTFAKIYVETGSGTKIGANAFKGACVKQLTTNITDNSVNISGGTVSEVGEYAFADMNVKGDFRIGDVVGNIKAHAFENATIGGKLEIRGQIDAVGEYAFAGVDIAGLSLPSIRKIGDYAFARTAFTRFQISPYLESLGSRIFDECTDLKKIILPEEGKMTEVASDAFPDREGLTIVIPENIVNFEIYHLEQYVNVTFQLPEGLPEDSKVLQFMENHHLNYVIGEPAETPGTSSTPTPDGTKNPNPAPTSEPTEEPSHVPTSEPTKEPGGVSTPEPTKEPGAISTSNPTQKPSSTPPSAAATKTPAPSGGGKAPNTFVNKKVKYKLMGSDKVSVVGYAGKSAKQLTVPSIVKNEGRLYKVTAIEKKAFRGFKKLQKVTVGNYVRTIGDEALSGCRQLKQISFGTGTAIIGKKVLYKDRKLKKIVFRGKHLKKIGKKTFYGVPKSVKIVVPKAKVKQYSKLVRKSR